MQKRRLYASGDDTIDTPADGCQREYGTRNAVLEPNFTPITYINDTESWATFRVVIVHLGLGSRKQPVGRTERFFSKD